MSEINFALLHRHRNRESLDGLHILFPWTMIDERQRGGARLKGFESQGQRAGRANHAGSAAAEFGLAHLFQDARIQILCFPGVPRGWIPLQFDRERVTGFDRDSRAIVICGQCRIAASGGKNDRKKHDG